MKLIATKTIRLGGRRYAEGDEFELPDKFARQMVAAGMASEPKPKKAAKKAEPEPVAKEAPVEEPKKTYKTRQIKAEDDV